MILKDHRSAPIRKERLSPTSKARREVSRNKFVEKGRMPDRVKSFRAGVPNQGCEMVIQIFVLHLCPVMLSSSRANSSAQSVSNNSMPNSRLSIQPETR